jgi:hypothetical protein
MIKVRGFTCGLLGSSGSTLSGMQRVARLRGDKEPIIVQGSKSQGRASTMRSYTINVTRESDGKRLEETIGPAYWPKSKWIKEQEESQKKITFKIGMERK